MKKELHESFRKDLLPSLENGCLFIVLLFVVLKKHTSSRSLKYLLFFSVSSSEHLGRLSTWAVCLLRKCQRQHIINICIYIYIY